MTGGCTTAVAIGAWLAILWGVVSRIQYLLRYNPMDNIWSDPQRHWEQGQRILQLDPFGMIDPIGYQLFVSLLAKATLGDPILISFYTIILAVVTPWIWYRFFRELQPSKTAALAGWAALSLAPDWTTIYGFIMQETLFLPMLGLALYATWRCRRKRDLGSFLFMVLLWVMAGLTRGIAIPMAAVACTWLWLAQGQRLPKAAYSLLILCAILGPLTYRSHLRMGLLAPHGIGQMNMIYCKSGCETIKIAFDLNGAKWMYVFQSPALKAKPLAPFSDWESSRRGTVEVSIDITKGAADWDAALASYPLTPRKYMWLTGENLVLLFFSEAWPDNMHRARTLNNIGLRIRWLWLGLGIAAFVLTLVQWRAQKRHLMFPAVLLAWLLVQGFMPICVNEGRYRLPYTGLVIAQLILVFGAWKRSTPSPRLIVDETRAATTRRRTPPRRQFPARRRTRLRRQSPARRRTRLRPQSPARRRPRRRR
jgi:hypothetical protein